MTVSRRAHAASGISTTSSSALVLRYAPVFATAEEAPMQSNPGRFCVRPARGVPCACHPCQRLTRELCVCCAALVGFASSGQGLMDVVKCMSDMIAVLLPLAHFPGLGLAGVLFGCLLCQVALSVPLHWLYSPVVSCRKCLVCKTATGWGNCWALPSSTDSALLLYAPHQGYFSAAMVAGCARRPSWGEHHVPHMLDICHAESVLADSNHLTGSTTQHFCNASSSQLTDRQR